MVQASVIILNNTKDLNEVLRQFQAKYPARKIISVCATEHEPAGWFITIAYDIN